MAYINLGLSEQQFPGIIGLLQSQPQTGRLLLELADALLRAPHTLTTGERELIGAYVSGLNDCKFCCNSHSAIAAAQLNNGMQLVEQVRADLDHAPISEKLRGLLRIAQAVQEGGLTVTSEMVATARREGATDSEIHDTVLIAAAFCMFNRYVDGLGTFTPNDPESYAQIAHGIVKKGYANFD
jgi:uncharacterized peroxidase-related enzyme